MNISFFLSKVMIREVENNVNVMSEQNVRSFSWWLTNSIHSDGSNTNTTWMHFLLETTERHSIPLIRDNVHSLGRHTKRMVILSLIHAVSLQWRWRRRCSMQELLLVRRVDRMMYQWGVTCNNWYSNSFQLIEWMCDERKKHLFFFISIQFKRLESKNNFVYTKKNKTKPRRTISSRFISFCFLRHEMVEMKERNT